MKKTGFIGYLTYIGKLALFLEWSILGEKINHFGGLRLLLSHRRMIETRYRLVEQKFDLSCTLKSV